MVYRSTFEKHPPLAAILEDYYSDILRFHDAALKVFKRPSMCCHSIPTQTDIDTSLAQDGKQYFNQLGKHLIPNSSQSFGVCPDAVNCWKAKRDRLLFMRYQGSGSKSPTCKRKPGNRSVARSSKNTGGGYPTSKRGSRLQITVLTRRWPPRIEMEVPRGSGCSNNQITVNGLARLRTSMAFCISMGYRVLVSPLLDQTLAHHV